MPEKGTLRRARAKERAGKAPTTQAGEFVREEIDTYQRVIKAAGIKPQ